MPDGERRIAPRVIAILTRLVHDAQSAATTVVRTITKAVFIATSAIAGPRSLPTVNARVRAKFDMALSCVGEVYWKKSRSVIACHQLPAASRRPCLFVVRDASGQALSYVYYDVSRAGEGEGVKEGAS